MAQLDQKQDFQARLARISQTAAQPEQRYMAKTKVKPKRKSGRPVKVSDWRENIRYPGAIVGAFLLGMIMVLLLSYIRFHLGMGALAGDEAKGMMLADLALAIAGGFVIKQIFHFEAKVFQSAQMAGVFAMVAVMHNFVHWMPKPFELAFSPDWTAQVIASTEPNSLLFGGASFGGDGETGGQDFTTSATPQAGKAADMPKLIVLDSER